MHTRPRFYIKKTMVEVPRIYSAWKCEDVVVRWEQNYLEEGAEENGFLFWKRVRYWYRTVWCYFEGTYNTCNPTEVKNVHEWQPRMPMDKIYSNPRFMWRWDDPGTASNPKGASGEFNITIGLTLKLDKPRYDNKVKPKVDINNDEDLDTWEGETEYNAKMAVKGDLLNGGHYEDKTVIDTIESSEIDRSLVDSSNAEFSFLAAGDISSDHSGMYIKTAGHRTVWLDANLPISSETLRGLGVFDGRTLDRNGNPVKYQPNTTYIIVGLDMSSHSPGSSWVTGNAATKVWVNYKDLRITLKEHGITDRMVAQ